MRKSMLYAVAAVVIASSLAGGMRVGAGDVNARWIDRSVAQSDRAWFGRMTGHAPPAFGADLTWIGSDPLTWESLKGKVVVLQSWSNRTAIGRTWSRRVAKLLAEYDAADVQAILLHTPEGANDAAKFLAEHPTDLPVAVDASGEFCDDLGVFRRPVNIIIDRNGAVRYVGLNPAGLKAAVRELVGESAQADFVLTAMPEPEEAPVRATTSAAKPRSTPPPYPSFNRARLSARNVQGKAAPALSVGTWLSAKPNTEGKVVVVDFWATWCGPCVASIPHMNDLSREFADSVVIVGLSNEDARTVKRFMQRKKMDYSVGVDQRGRMASAIGVQGIPHAVVVSPDGVVRWQGFAPNLSSRILGQIVAAAGAGDEEPAAPETSIVAPSRRWSTWRGGA